MRVTGCILLSIERKHLYVSRSSLSVLPEVMYNEVPFVFQIRANLHNVFCSSEWPGPRGTESLSDIENLVSVNVRKVSSFSKCCYSIHVRKK